MMSCPVSFGKVQYKFFCTRFQWCVFIIISRASKWGTFKSAGNPRCAVHAEIHSICPDRRDLGPVACLQVSPTSDTCQSVAIFMSRRHFFFKTIFWIIKFLRILSKMTERKMSDITTQSGHFAVMVMSIRNAACVNTPYFTPFCHPVQSF